MKFSAETLKQAEALIEACRLRGVSIVTAESCTGGLVAGALTDISGSSDVLLGGFVTYSNEMKSKVLNVPQKALDKYGAVSSTVARAMADGALEISKATIAISITGIAGPTGGSDKKPVGLVYFGLATTVRETNAKKMEYGALSRNEIREACVNTALQMLIDIVTDNYEVITQGK